MPYVTTIERSGMLRLIKDTLLTKFGDDANELFPAIAAFDDAEKYVALNRAIATATTLDQVRRACAKVAAPRRKKRDNAS